MIFGGFFFEGIFLLGLSFYWWYLIFGAIFFWFFFRFGGIFLLEVSDFLGVFLAYLFRGYIFGVSNFWGYFPKNLRLSFGGIFLAGIFSDYLIFGGIFGVSAFRGYSPKIFGGKKYLNEELYLLRRIEPVIMRFELQNVNKTVEFVFRLFRVAEFAFDSNQNSSQKQSHVVRHRFLHFQHFAFFFVKLPRAFLTLFRTVIL